MEIVKRLDKLRSQDHERKEIEEELMTMPGSVGWRKRRHHLFCQAFLDSSILICAYKNVYTFMNIDIQELY